MFLDKFPKIPSPLICFILKNLDAAIPILVAPLVRGPRLSRFLSVVWCAQLPRIMEV